MKEKNCDQMPQQDQLRFLEIVVKPTKTSVEEEEDVQWTQQMTERLDA
jgi:hypothetical protein